MPKKGDRREKDGKGQVWHHELGWVSRDMAGWNAAERAEEASLATLLDSYGKVLRAQVDMDLSKTCDRDWRNLQTLLVERPEIGERTISYLVNALQDAAEKRMSKYCERSDAENERDFERLQPGTWTTLPPDFGYDVVTDWPYEATDSEEQIVIAGADTQSDGTMAAFYTVDLGEPWKETNETPAIEITPAGLAALASAEIFETPLSDEAIIDIAVSNSAHKERSSTGIAYEVISHAGLIEFAREIEAHVVDAAVKQIRGTTKRP
ncbi:hypothetical protein [Rhizobium sp. LCM 4573]|uniref:hypothetical protein n=1 Tax=Rhizobium sp. LCM 4573 TaxID=1848291 RepID=UPI0008D935F7|nr:hypothetical protein [Rhizobium sp. LCM 4573]OHV83671.1 hypothetical protein LCM4573_06075 [Rhizobium sp. LCM 4573]